MLGSPLSRNVILLSLLFFSFVVNSTSIGSVKRSNNVRTNYTTISADNIQKSKRAIPNTRKNTSVSSPRKTQSKNNPDEMKAEVIYLKTSANHPVVVNKTERFVFRNITMPVNGLISGKSLEERSYEIDYLRKKMKSN